MFKSLKFNFKSEWFSLSLIFISFALGFYFFQHFPVRVPNHWNINGDIDGYSGKFWGAFLIPFMMVGMYFLFIIVPYLDPKKDQYSNFSEVYSKFKDLFITFFFIVFSLIGLSGLGYKIDVGFYIPILVGVLFIILGRLLKDVKMNWFLGIRTPWTLSSEKVWQKTHELSRQVFLISGLLMAATVLVPVKFKLVFFIVALGLIIFSLPIYSYILYVREQKTKKN